jgi:very-short-patch-repair endonuclease
MKHNKCGHEWEVLPKNFISKSVSSRCPVCSKTISKGEKIIIKFLEENKINFDYDKPIFGSRLRADFILYDKKIIIEFDGIQHFKNKSLFEDFEIIRKRDEEKNNLIRKNNFTIVRLSYKIKNQLKSILENIILRKKFNDYRLSASTIEAYWKQKTDVFISEDIVSSA